ncbi:putative hydrolase YdeN [bioreactor metagenome]|uniref:Putative hydrolase YdeN n=1 Tax=bioreactor metagenome TaxID=1076179 RepID=A0A644XER2_9ZZZZ|nr:alpha/beta hydrolase [Candidatus Metalachnospira sp.]
MDVKLTEKNIYIVHGYTASSKANWFPWIKEQLEAKGIKTYIPDMPDSQNPYYDNWLAHLSETITDINDETIFIGHSLGCIASMRFLLEKNIKIKGAIFVSGFIDENPMEVKTVGLQSFFNDPLDIGKLKCIIPNRVAITAVDDDIVPTNATKIMADKINAQLLELKSGKHFIDRDGYTKFPLILTEVEHLINID